MWWAGGCWCPAAAAFFKPGCWLLEQLQLLQQCPVVAAGQHSICAVKPRGCPVTPALAFCPATLSNAGGAQQQLLCASMAVPAGWKVRGNYRTQQQCGNCCMFVFIVHVSVQVRGMQLAVRVVCQGCLMVWRKPEGNCVHLQLKSLV